MADHADVPSHLLRSRLKLRHLRLLIVLDDCRKLGHAAAALNLSQPAASKLLGEIEALVGVQLFERLPRGVEPTAFGEVLVRRSRAMLTELNLADEELKALRAGEGGVVTIGAVTAPACDIVVDALHSLHRQRLGLRVNVEVNTSPALARQLLAGELDFAIARITGDVDAEPFAYEEIGVEKCCLVVRDSHPLAGCARVKPEDLADQDWVLQTQGSLLRLRVEEMLRRHGVPVPGRVINTSSVLVSMALARSSDMVVALAAGVADLFCSAGGFVILPLDERVVVEPYGLIRMRGKELSPAAHHCLEAVRQAVRERALMPVAPPPG